MNDSEPDPLDAPKTRKGDPPIIAAYRRIMWAALRGKGVRLSPQVVRHMGLHDDAIMQAVWQHDVESEAARKEAK